MSIDRGDDVPKDETQAEFIETAELTQMYRAPCKPLKRDDADTYKYKLLRSDAKAEYRDYLITKNLQIPDDWYASDFAKANSLPKLKVYRLVCPWYAEDSLPVQLQLDYTESTNPINGRDAPQKLLDFNWLANDVLIGDGQAEEVVPSSYSGDEPWACEFTLTRVTDAEDCANGSVRCDAVLTSTTYDGDLIGTPVEQTRTITCAEFLAESLLFQFFWTGTTFPAGPVGVVKVLFAQVVYNP